MALIKRSELQTALREDRLQLACSVFLFFGERYLCREAADLVQHHLLAQQPGAVHTIDGDTEDPGQTLARLTSFSLLPGRQIYRVADSRIFHSKNVASEIWQRATAAYQGGRPKPALRHLQSMAQAAGLQGDEPGFFSEIPKEEWKKIFGFDKPTSDLYWADALLLQGQAASRNGDAGIIDRYIEVLDKGIAAGNVLLLTAETVDKRQRLFTYLKKNCIIVDCSVASGSHAAAQNEQKNILKEMMLKTLDGFGKKIDARAVDIFFDRVGFHPIAVVTETEKLAHYVGDRPLIASQDLDEMVSRNREDALYELTDAFSKRQTVQTLTILARLLDQGMHPLAILATLRNYLRKQLIFRSLQLRDTPRWHQGMQAKEFQNSYLPDLKAQGQWNELLKGHPYALFMNFTRAATYSCSGLKRWLNMLLEAEYRLKGSSLPQRLVLEELFLSMMKGSPKLHV